MVHVENLFDSLLAPLPSPPGALALSALLPGNLRVFRRVNVDLQ